MSCEDLAALYHQGVTAARQSGVQADPEAQLTTPVEQLLVGLASRTGIGVLQLIREQQLKGSRPDFGAVIDGRFCGMIELKKPDTAIDSPSTWTGHNGRQWQRLAELDNLLLCNGREARRFALGEQQGEAVRLPYEAGSWDPVPTERLLRQFAEGTVRPITSVRHLAERLAPLARDLRDRVAHSLGHHSRPGASAAQDAYVSWRRMLQEDADEAQFADAVAQVITYGLVIVALEDESADGTSAADVDGDGLVSLAEAREALKAKHRLLSASLSPIIEVHGFLALITLEVSTIERLVAGIDRAAIRRKKDPRGEPWLWFYEDFLATYDPKARREAGVYYTPVEVVDCMTRLVDDVIVNDFGKPLGFGDPTVTTLDPACGTGTFPLSVVDRAAERASEELGKAGPGQVATTLGGTLFGFELLPGPFAVAHLRIAERLHALGGTQPENGINILLADALASPNGDDTAQLGLFGDAAVLAAERQRARRVKREQPVMVVLGNPPYRRTDRGSAGGWVVHGDDKTPADKAPFAEVVEDAKKHTIFSHRRSLYNLYTYFWRWGIWKAFEAHEAGPAVVAFITASSWIDGAGFVGLRRLAAKHCDDIYVIDLGGDNRTVVRDENVFSIESPVAIVVLVRRDRSDGRRKPTVHFRRVEGTAAQKRAALRDVHAPRKDASGWTSEPINILRGFAPPTGELGWQSLPEITDLMPWQQPGCIISRLWPVGPEPDVLKRRWEELLDDPDPDIRAERFQTANSGRNMNTEHAELGRLSALNLNPPM